MTARLHFRDATTGRASLADAALGIPTEDKTDRADGGGVDRPAVEVVTTYEGLDCPRMNEAMRYLVVRDAAALAKTPDWPICPIRRAILASSAGGEAEAGALATLAVAGVAEMLEAEEVAVRDAARAASRKTVTLTVAQAVIEESDATTPVDRRI